MAIYNWKASDFTVGEQPTAWVVGKDVTSFLIANDADGNYLSFQGNAGTHSLLHFTPAGTLTDFELRVKWKALGGNEGLTGRSDGATNFYRFKGDLGIDTQVNGAFEGTGAASSLSVDGSLRWQVVQSIGDQAKSMRYLLGQSPPESWYLTGTSLLTSPGDVGLWSYSGPELKVYEFEVRTGSDMLGFVGPTITTSNNLQPGESFTLTATNFASTPVSPATLTPLDANGDAITGITPITVAVTITGSGPYTAIGTMPTLAEAVTAGTSIPFGSTRISLST